MLRRLSLSVALVSVVVLSNVGHAGAVMPDPDAHVPAEIVVSQLGMMRSDVERYRDALTAGRFGAVADTDLPRFDGLIARIDELATRTGEVTAEEMAYVVLDAAVLLQELAGRDGADPVLVEEISFMFGPATISPVPTPVDATAPTVVTTAPPTVPARVPTEAVAGAATTAPAPMVAAAPVTAVSAGTPSAPAPSRGVNVASVLSWMFLALVAAVAVGVIARLLRHWQRARLPKPTGRAGFTDLFDVSWRLAAAGSAEEVEVVAVRQFVRLTGANAGAFIHHRDRRLSVGFETEAGLLVGERLRDGILDRVVGNGAEVARDSIEDPAIRTSPTSMVAVPVYLRGTVIGAIVAVRDATTPFTELDVRMASDLKPIIGAAFEQVHHTQQVQAEAYTDVLTNVANRRALDARVGALGEQFFAAVMVDLDRFKAVNDTHGHAAGDDLLRAVAARLVANVRPGDGVYRYGGEEFAILMPHADETPATEVAERVRRAIEAAPFRIGPAQVVHAATASLGVATGVGGVDVLGRADGALYEAKRSGRNRVVLASAPTAGDPIVPVAVP